MSHCMVTLSANAGVCLALGRSHIWVDALHQGKVPGFSTLSPELWRQLKEHPAFQSPDLICFTHCHPDHYSLPLVQQACALWPGAALVSPSQALPRQYVLAGPNPSFSCEGLHLEGFPLPHMGEEYRETTHYGLLITKDSFRILVSGDCEVASPALGDAVMGRPVDLAIMPFPWITLSKGREFLRNVLRPRHLLICHLPFRADDCYGYRKAAAWAVPKLPELPDVRLLQDPFQCEII